MIEFSILSIAIGGAFGSIARYLVSKGMGNLIGDFLPYGTLTVNMLGSFALGWLVTFFIEHPEINNSIRLGLTVGFLGAFTTFSAFSLETIEIFLEGKIWRTIFNISTNLTICLGMCYLGMKIAQTD